MKKVLVVLSLICFVAFNTTNAQSSDPVAVKETKKEASATPAANDKETPAVSGHSKAMKACCKKGDTKNCTPAERAACGDKAQVEAEPKAE